MIVLRNGEVVVAYNALLQLSQMRLPLKTSMHVRRLVRAVKPAAEDVQAERQRLIDEYAVKVAGKPEVDAHGVVNFGGNRDAYIEAHRELMALEAPVDGEPVPASALEVAEIQPALLVDLGDLLVDDLG